MSKSKFLAATFVVLCFLFNCSETQAQAAYGYGSIVYDEGTNMVSGYASTDLDYTTAYYYDAQVDAQITDDNGNTKASGSNTGNPTAMLNLDVIDVLLCIPYDIIIEIIVRPRYYDYFSDCGYGYYDYFGFYDNWWGSFWDYGSFTANRPRSCSYTNIFYIARIIARVIECFPVHTTCGRDRNEILPSGFRQKWELPWVSGTDKVNFTCTTNQSGTSTRVSGQTVNIRLDSHVVDSGGHVSHTGTRPLGKLDRTTAKSDSNGETKFVLTAPIFGGSTRVVLSVPGGDNTPVFDTVIKVPGLQELPSYDNYHKIGSNTKHPFNHYGKPETITGLQQIANDYKAEYYPNGFPPNPPGMNPADNLGPNDWYKIHYNDMSLPNGGKFDIDKDVDWKANGSHDEHRVGINCDTRSKNIPTNRWTRLKQIFEERGSPKYYDHTSEPRAPHWHLRFTGNVQVSQDLTTNPFGESPASIPGTIEAEQYDQGSNTAAYFIPFTGVLDPEEKPVDVTVSDTQNGIRYVNSTLGGQWMNYTVNISSSGSYTFDTSVASSVGGGTFHFEVDGIDKTGPIGIPYTGSNSAFQSVVVDDIYLDAGQHTVKLVVDGSGQNVASFDSFTVNPYIAPEVCNPPYWEIQDCQISGGYWDNYFCQCNYGMY